MSRPDSPSSPSADGPPASTSSLQGAPAPSETAAPGAVGVGGASSSSGSDVGRSTTGVRAPRESGHYGWAAGMHERAEELKRLGVSTAPRKLEASPPAADAGATATPTTTSTPPASGVVGASGSAWNTAGTWYVGKEIFFFLQRLQLFLIVPKGSVVLFLGKEGEGERREGFFCLNEPFKVH